MGVLACNNGKMTPHRHISNSSASTSRLFSQTHQRIQTVPFPLSNSISSGINQTRQGQWRATLAMAR
jgi:hypothetical protein